MMELLFLLILFFMLFLFLCKLFFLSMFVKVFCYVGMMKFVVFVFLSFIVELNGCFVFVGNLFEFMGLMSMFVFFKIFLVKLN